MAQRKNIARDDILLSAHALLATVGFHGFSMRDLADEVGISSASLHHHTPTKDELATAVVQRERDRLNKRLASIGAEHEDWPRRRPELMQSLAETRLTAVLAAELAGLPPKCQAELRLLHSNLIGWLTRFATEAIRRQEMPQNTEPEALAATMLALAQGAALYSTLAPVDPTWLLADLRPVTSAL